MMAASKIKIVINRSVSILACLLVSLLSARFFYLHEYIWGAVYVGLVLVVIYRFIKDRSDPDAQYGNYYFMLVFGIYLSYHEYSDYKRDQLLDKYGLIYNKTRQSLGIPIIPAGWHTESKGDSSVEWIGKNGAQGHEGKYISLYKGKFERDEYNFKGINDTTRTISILFKYGKGKSRDSIFYMYNLKDTTFIISRHQADSLFDEAKIRKDY